MDSDFLKSHLEKKENRRKARVNSQNIGYHPFAAMTALSRDVEDKLKLYRTLQGEIQSIYGKKTQTLSQFNENTLVKGELDLLTEGSRVMKLVGPVMMSVELEEAKENVAKRLEFIEGEVQKLDTSMEQKEKELAKLGDEIATLQQKMQAEAAVAARQVAAEVTS